MKIVTDCGAEFSAEELETLGITQAPLYINFANESINSANIKPDDFYDRLEASFPVIPLTSQPSSGEFAEIYQKLSESDPEILSIHISSGLSGTIQSAQAGADQVGSKASVSIFDTMTLSGAERLQVQVAALAARAGWSLQLIRERLEQIRARTETIFTLDTLDYLAHGGRIGRVQAMAGSLLKIKPVIHVDHKDGKYSTVSKSRNIQHATEMIANRLVDMYGSTPVWVNLMHGRYLEMAETLSRLLKNALNIHQMDILRVSPVLGVHTGPKIVGVTIVPYELLKDLI
jgi:DegV family protein with EDD domain